MSYNLVITNAFERDAKPLLKKYKLLKNDLAILFESLEQEPVLCPSFATRGIWFRVFNFGFILQLYKLRHRNQTNNPFQIIGTGSYRYRSNDGQTGFRGMFVSLVENNYGKIP
jgi:hypothetical protein